MKTMEYLLAATGDIDLLIDYRIMFSDELNGKLDALAEKELRASLHHYFETELNRNYFCWYAKLGAVVTGIGGMGIRIQPGNARNPSGKWAYIMSMYVLPDYRRRGICGNIISRLVTTANEQGISAIELHATKTGEAVYTKYGFVKHSEPTYRKHT